MMRTTSVLAAILACTILVLTGGADAFRTQQSPAIFTQQLATNVDFLNRIRGGAVDVDIESSDEEEESDEEEDAPTLAKSAKKAATKAVKKSVAAALTPKKKKSFSLGNFFKLPYIVKACLNPLVFWQMTAGYWKSLYNINYMQENVSLITELFFLS